MAKKFKLLLCVLYFHYLYGIAFNRIIVMSWLLDLNISVFSVKIVLFSVFRQISLLRAESVQQKLRYVLKSSCTRALTPGLLPYLQSIVLLIFTIYNILLHLGSPWNQGMAAAIYPTIPNWRLCLGGDAPQITHSHVTGRRSTDHRHARRDWLILTWQVKRRHICTYHTWNKPDERNQWKTWT